MATIYMANQNRVKNKDHLQHSREMTNPPLHVLPYAHVGAIWKLSLHGDRAMLVAGEGSRKPHGAPDWPGARVGRGRAAEHLGLGPQSALAPLRWGALGHCHRALLRTLLLTIHTLLLLLLQNQLSDTLTL